MKLIDTHCHLNFKDFKEDADEVIKRTLAEETGMILVGSEYKTSVRAVDYANKYENDAVYAAIGLHPIHLEDIKVKNDNENGTYEFHSRAEEFDYNKYLNLAKDNKKVVAIGEIGLDYFHIDKEADVSAVKDKQKKVLRELLFLAHELNLPVIIHCREAHDDLLEILKEFQDKCQRTGWGVIHCFSGDEALANEYFKLGLIISFTGLITFSKNWDELIKNVALDKIMVETDAPYMAPNPYRGKRNEPLYVEYVAEKIAELKGINPEEVMRKTTENARRLFGLG